MRDRRREAAGREADSAAGQAEQAGVRDHRSAPRTHRRCHPAPDPLRDLHGHPHGVFLCSRLSLMVGCARSCWSVRSSCRTSPWSMPTAGASARARDRPAIGPTVRRRSIQCGENYPERRPLTREKRTRPAQPGPRRTDQSPPPATRLSLGPPGASVICLRSGYAIEQLYNDAPK